MKLMILLEKELFFFGLLDERIAFYVFLSDERINLLPFLSGLFDYYIAFEFRNSVQKSYVSGYFDAYIQYLVDLGQWIFFLA